MTTYAIRGGAEGKRRLDLLAQTMAPTTMHFSVPSCWGSAWRPASKAYSSA
jgi:hypothetical protein